MRRWDRGRPKATYQRSGTRIVSIRKRTSVLRCLPTERACQGQRVLSDRLLGAAWVVVRDIGYLLAVHQPEVSSRIARSSARGTDPANNLPVNVLGLRQTDTTGGQY